jgi:hypothetical protein
MCLTDGGPLPTMVTVAGLTPGTPPAEGREEAKCLPSFEALL